MKESITAYPISGINPVALSIVSELPFRKGGAEAKTLIEASVGFPGRQHRLTLVERGRRSEYIEKWHLLRNAGLPVIPTLRESSRGTILLTDLRHDGAEIYGKGMWGEIKEGNYPYEKIKEIDNIFLDVTSPSNVAKVQNEAARLTSLANDSDIQLPWDDPFEIVVHPNGKWELIIIDVQEADDNGNFLKPEVVAKWNKEYADEFLLQIQEINKVFAAVRCDEANGTYTAQEEVERVRTRFWMKSIGLD